MASVKTLYTKLRLEVVFNFVMHGCTLVLVLPGIICGLYCVVLFGGRT